MFPQKAQKLLNQRKADARFRQLKVYNHEWIDFHSNDYLGIAKKMEHFVPKKSHSGAGGSRLISGNSAYYLATERYLADFYLAEKTLLFSSGYTANLAMMSSVPQRGDTILYDEWVHASIRDGIRLSYAKNYAFRHNDLEDLQKKSQQAQGSVFVVTEGVFSMDGDTAPINEMAKMCQQNGWFLILDEAHSSGILGTNRKGVFEDSLCSIFARIHTFGKAVGTHGAIIAGDSQLIDFLVNFARPFIYTTALSEAQLEVIRQSHSLLNQAQLQAQQLQAHLLYFKEKIKQKKLSSYFLESNTPIQAFLHSSEVLQKIETTLHSNRIAAKAIYAPTVPKNKERIRLIVHSFNTQDEIDTLFEIIPKLI